MDDCDPFAGYEVDMNQLFVHAPSEFELKLSKLSWESPCWLCADILLCPRTPEAREKFFLNLNMPCRLDAFARVSWDKQLSTAFSQRISKVNGPYKNEWWDEFVRCYRKLTEHMHGTESLFSEPLRFAKREEFTSVDLPTILKETPETLSIYLAREKGTYLDYFFLRIHSSPPFTSQNPKCLWFEKRLPELLHTEDILPWFIATIRRLPKKHQPTHLETWTKRLIDLEPQLSPPLSGPEEPWMKKPKVVIVFGPIGKVGYRGLSHFERRDISSIVCQNEVVTIKGKIRYAWADNKSTEFDRTFHLLAFDEDAAKRIEQQILHGKRIHFGLDSEILGMISCSEDMIHTINAPVEMIQRLCVLPGVDLLCESNPQDKIKAYKLIKHQKKSGAV